MLGCGKQMVLCALAMIGGLWFGIGQAQADTLYFRQTEDANGINNASWLSTNNWYTLGLAQNGALQYTHAFTIPGAADEAVLVDSSILPGSALVEKVVIGPGRTLTGGDLTVSFLELDGGASANLITEGLIGVTTTVRAQMNVFGAAVISGGTLNLMIGAIASVDSGPAGNVGDLTLASGAVFSDQGSLILHDKATLDAGVADGTSTLRIFPGADLSTTGAVAITTDFSRLNIEDNGHIICNSGTLDVSGAVTFTSTAGTGLLQTTIPAATILFESFTMPAGSHLAIKGPGQIQFKDNVNVSGLLDVGLLDSATGPVESGTVVIGPANLSGTGTLHVIASPTVASTLTMTGVVNSANQFGTSFTGAMNIDPGATFVASTLNSSINLSGTINNDGTTVFKGGEFVIWNGSTFNNLPGAVFDVQQTGSVHDAGQVGHFNNKGTFRHSAGVGEADVAIAFNNTGLIDLRAGTTKFFNLVQTAGATELNGGNLLSPSSNGDILHPLDIEGGVLAGTGSINGDLYNAATVSPGPVAGPVQFGTLALTGNYTQTATGVLDLKIGGTAIGTQTDRLTVTGSAALLTGSATLAGTLNAPLVNGFHPLATARFPVLSYGSKTGTFSTVAGPFTATYGTTQTVLALNPNAPTITSFTPTSALAGTPVTVNGTNLTGAVLFFNGVRAVLDASQSSATRLVTMVPSNATTGPLKVTTATGSFITATPFAVIPLIHYAISGAVTRGGLPLANVPLLLVSRANLAALAGGIVQPTVVAASAGILARSTTNAAGQYSFSVLAGSYFVFPVLTGVVFNPLERAVVVNTAPVPNQNFALASTDAAIPVATITTAAPARVSGSAALSGTGASGILSVVVTLQNHSGQYLDWTATGTAPVFTATPTLGSFKTASAPGSTGSLLNLNLVLTQLWTVVPPANLAPGTYTVTARAISRAMRVSAPATKTFIVSAPTAPDIGLATSSVALSNAVASGDAVRLRFSGALDTDAATDPAHYTVLVNGHTATVEVVSYDATHGSVTLGLPTGTLHAGDHVSTAWTDLRDGQGRTLNGRTAPLTAIAR